MGQGLSGLTHIWLCAPLPRVRGGALARAPSKRELHYCYLASSKHTVVCALGQGRNPMMRAATP